MRRTLILCCLPVLLPVAVLRAEYASVLIRDVPHVLQKSDFCGEACAEMWLRKLGKKWTQDQVFNTSGLDAALGRGCYTRELNTALKRIGFSTGEVWHTIVNDKAPEQIEAQFKSLHADLLAGVPSIICMHYDDRAGASEHFRLILGYDAKTAEIIYNEPAVANARYLRMKRSLFQKLWPLKLDDRTSALIRLRLSADKLTAPPASSGYTAADFAQHVLAMKDKLPAGFTVVVQPPFVVVGDGPAEAVRQRANDTVHWAADRLKRDYFAHDPDEILDIWLFKDDASYRKYTKKIFNDDPDTPFGYYSSVHKALIMNIGTGGGTLVHEIVHPFMRANFPQCPPWFNEGMGSLYEQCGDHNGHIYGYTNWRLAGLQEAVNDGTVPTFEKLTGMDDNQFYRQDRGTNYAQSRYLCYYLQEKGLLVRFYKEFVSSAKADPSGYKTLSRILGEKDMDAFKKRWESFVLRLHFP